MKTYVSLISLPLLALSHPTDYFDIGAVSIRSPESGWTWGFSLIFYDIIDNEHKLDLDLLIQSNDLTRAGKSWEPLPHNHFGKLPLNECTSIGGSASAAIISLVPHPKLSPKQCLPEEFVVFYEDEGCKTPSITARGNVPYGLSKDREFTVWVTNIERPWKSFKYDASKCEGKVISSGAFDNTPEPPKKPTQ